MLKMKEANKVLAYKFGDLQKNITFVLLANSLFLAKKRALEM